MEDVFEREVLEIPLDSDCSNHLLNIRIEHGEFWSNRNVVITDKTVDLNVILKRIVEGRTTLTDIEQHEGMLTMPLNGHEVIVGTWEAVNMGDTLPELDFFITANRGDEVIEVRGDELETKNFKLAPDDRE